MNVGHGALREWRFVLIPSPVSKYAKVDESGCWLWTSAVNREGYGYKQRRNAGRHQTLMAHRWVYELLKGQIPPGLEIDHTCRVRRCVNRKVASR